MVINGQIEVYPQNVEHAPFSNAQQSTFVWSAQYLDAIDFWGEECRARNASQPIQQYWLEAKLPVA